MNNIKDSDFLGTFPPALKKNDTFLILGKLIAEELHITAQETEKNIIYAKIDSLSETWLDVLAYDLHVDWYDYDYPIEVKRATIRDSVKVHQKLGTKAAVEMALGNIHPMSEIEEWFDYNGKPYRFRIVLDTTKSRIQADYDEIIRTVDIYKRLTAHLDGLYYQCSMSIVVTPKTEYYIFHTPITGWLKTGTKPDRNREGAVARGNVAVVPKTVNYTIEAVRTGTKLYRNIVFTKNDCEIVTDSDTKRYGYTSDQTGKAKAGTAPYISTAGGAATEGANTTVEGKSYKYYSDFTGTNPDRNIVFQSEEVAAVGEMEAGNYIFENGFTGTTPHRNIAYAEGEEKVVADFETENYEYDTQMTGRTTVGTKSSRAVETESEENGISQTTDTESYQYSVKRCGSNSLSK